MQSHHKSYKVAISRAKKRLCFLAVCALNRLKSPKVSKQSRPCYNDYFIHNTLEDKPCISFLLLTSKVWNVLSAADLTDFIPCLRNGHNLGTRPLNDLASLKTSIETEGQANNPASKVIILLVDAVKSSSSTSVSHRVVTSSSICPQIKTKLQMLKNNSKIILFKK